MGFPIPTAWAGLHPWPTALSCALLASATHRNGFEMAFESCFFEAFGHRGPQEMPENTSFQLNLS